MTTKRKKTEVDGTLMLPRSVNGRKLPEHPIFMARRRVPRSTLAKAMGVQPQALVVWEQRCRDNRDYLLPANRIRAIALAADVPPWALRPDVFDPSWGYPADVLEKLADFLNGFSTPTRGHLRGART